MRAALSVLVFSVKKLICFLRVFAADQSVGWVAPAGDGEQVSSHFSTPSTPSKAGSTLIDSFLQ